jgi:hypothetical protein
MMPIDGQRDARLPHQPQQPALVGNRIDRDLKVICNEILKIEIQKFSGAVPKQDIFLKDILIKKFFHLSFGKIEASSEK